jgi:hypothetical protein
MSAAKSRVRLVCFRLTDEEHALVRKKCNGMGERSVSNFARATLLQQSRAVRANLGDDLATISAHLLELNQMLRALTSHIDGLLGTSKQKRPEQIAEVD